MRMAEVLGHEAVRRDLGESIARGRVGSAYLFCGPAGAGRRTLIRAFAAALLCGAGRRTLIRAFAAALLCGEASGDACGQCKSCRLFQSGNHPDFVELEASKAEISVAEMRAFCKEAGMKPTESPRRVCALMDADRMNLASGNCFLKTLEEPPGATVLLLRAESPDQLLRTVVSRCRVTRLGPLPEETIASALVARGAADAKSASTLARMAEGSLGRALLLGTAESAELWEWLKRTMETLRPGGALAFSDELVARAAENGSDAARMRARSGELLDLLAAVLRGRLRNEPHPRRTLRRLEETWQASERLGRNVNPDLVLRALALQLAEA